ncbi:hypothetical protein PF011_g27879 [Phytophthora fragariae]|uniref:RxLR effector protein n=1 Tax=Phytophthora fragariae TaxID=53985 RepID=A0A6A3HCH6_9STRA|nr:hypothetical protein PF011_g27879 [Phytophthora fragariae]KAE9306340.1 hypothetical protein PF008_g21491 [Phytophthora fragariae]
MRLSQVLVMITASFLVTSEALSTATDSNQAKIVKVTSPTVPSQRLLRTHHKVVDDEDDSFEERGLSNSVLESICQRLGINFERASREATYLQNHAQFEAYKQMVDTARKAKRAKKAQQLTRDGPNY